MKYYFVANIILTILDFIFGIYRGRSLKAHIIYAPINLLIGLPFQVIGFIYTFVATLHNELRNNK